MRRDQGSDRRPTPSKQHHYSSPAAGASSGSARTANAVKLAQDSRPDLSLEGYLPRYTTFLNSLSAREIV
jgi:hypothetical protein